MEHVRHRVDEDAPWLPPAQRHLEPVRPEAQVETLFVGVFGNSAEALRERFGVAMCATGRHLVTACYGIPGGVRPLNRALAAHADVTSLPAVLYAARHRLRQ